MMRRQIGIFVFLCVLVASGVAFPGGVAAVDCPVAGTVPITDRSAARAAGIPDDQQCWNPRDATVGLNAGQAKQYLDSLPKRCTSRGPGCWAPPDLDHIMKLNDQLAICAAQFLEAYIAQYGQVQMSSAFRCGPRSPAAISCDRTENARAGGATESNHQLGLAIDVNPKGTGASYETLWSYARANPRFGICFPYLGGDAPHLTLAGTNSGEAARCAQQGVTRPCDGMEFTPVVAGNIPAPAAAIPTSALAGMIRSLVMPMPPPPINANQPISSSYNPGMYFQPSAPDVPVATGNSVIPASGVSEPPRPVSELIAALEGPATPPRATTTNSSTTSDLISAIHNVSVVQSSGKPTVATGSRTVVVASLTPQNTFTSRDLRYSPPTSPQASSTRMYVVLESLRQALLKILDFLTPFKKRYPPSVSLVQ